MSEPDRPDDAGGTTPVSQPRIEVVRGGRLRAEQTAALTVAIVAHTSSAPHAGPVSTEHAWSWAARIEATGRPRIDRPGDLDHLDLSPG